MGRKQDHVGRPTKLTKELQRKLAKIIATQPISLEAACGLVGISYSSFHNWYGGGELAQVKLDKGEELNETEQTHLEFFLAMRHAKDKCEAMLVKDLMDNGAGPDKRWILKNRYPKRWRDSKRLELEVSGGVEHTHTHLHGHMLGIPTEALGVLLSDPEACAALQVVQRRLLALCPELVGGAPRQIEEQGS